MMEGSKSHWEQSTSNQSQKLTPSKTHFIGFGRAVRVTSTTWAENDFRQDVNRCDVQKSSRTKEHGKAGRIHVRESLFALLA